MKIKIGATATLAFTATSAEMDLPDDATGVPAKTVHIIADSACFIKFGITDDETPPAQVDVTATTTDFYLHGGNGQTDLVFDVSGYTHLAVKGVSTGDIYVTAVED